MVFNLRANSHFITTEIRSLMLENAEYSVFDLRRDDQIVMQTYADELQRDSLSEISAGAY